MRILLAEDDNMLRVTITDFLEGRGHEVVAAKNGGQASRVLLDDQGFDSIITDNRMPRITGIELLQDFWREDYNIPTLLHSSEDVGYLNGEQKLAEFVSYFPFAQFAIKQSNLAYIQTFLDEIERS